MPETIRTILEELYQIEPELKAHEAELAPLILKLVKAKPDIKPSASFVASFKLKLMNKEKEIMSNQTSPSENLTAWMKIASFMRQPFMLTGVAVVIFALILVSSIPGALKRTAKPNIFTAQITQLPAGAFGTLLATNEGAPAAGLGGGGSKMAAPQAVAESDNTAVSASPAPAGYGGGAVADRAMIYPYPSYNYTYTGETLGDLPAQVDVLKRVKNVGTGIGTGFFKTFDVGNLKLDSFTGANLSQITLTEEKEFGYVISVDFLEGMVNIFENWRRWPQPFNDCRDEACYRNLQMKPGDIPADSELIAMANDWLNLHGISTADYGEPYVQNDWRMYYEQAEDKSMAYVPDVVQVIYPLRINETAVYEYGGSAMGLGVNINVRYDRVSGLWNLMSQQYQSSSYEAETDFATLVKYATSGMQGYPMPLAYPELDGIQPEQINFTLGTPSRGYMRYWHYQNNDNQELLLPALIFPVQSETDQYVFMPRSIVVPMVKEFLQSTNVDGPIRIMPATPPSAGVSSGSAGSATIEPAVVDAPPAAIEPETVILPSQ